MKFTVHSHCSGSSKVAANLKRDIESAIAAIDVKIEKGAAPRIRVPFLESIISAGWSKYFNHVCKNGRWIVSPDRKHVSDICRLDQASDIIP